MDHSAINGSCWKSKLLVITRGYWGFSTSRNCGRSFCITGLVFIKSWPETMFLPAGGKPRQRFNVFENTHILSVACTAYVTSLGWVGWGMLTFMLTCVTCTSYIILCYVTGFGVGMWTPRRTVLWRSQVEPWKTVWQCELEKKTRRVFRNKFPVIYRLSFENHFKIPGNFEPILGHESVVSLWRKTTFFFKNHQNAGAVFPPGGNVFVYEVWVFSAKLSFQAVSFSWY